MARTQVPPLRRQLRRVRRRLFLQTLLDGLVTGWVVALAASAAWFAAQPHLLPASRPSLRWALAGGALALVTLAALARALLRRPSAVDAALAIDERFGLKERVTTGLTLAPADAATPAAAALLEDVNGRVERLAVPERFPVRLRRGAWLLPVAGAALALVAVFYKPVLALPKAAADEPVAVTPAAREEINKKLEQLRRKPEEKRPDDKNRSAELERMDAELDRLTRQPRDTKDQARELVKDLTGIEEQIKKREEELRQRADALKEQMKQISRLTKGDKDGPAKELNQALEQGDVQKARDALERLGQQLKEEEEAERLRKKLEDKGLSREERAKAEERLKQLKAKQMSKEERDKLAKQMKGIKDKVERLSKKKEEKEKALRDKADKGELSQEQLQRELERLEHDAGKLTEKDLEKLKDLADKLGKSADRLAEGDNGEAAKTLDEAAEELGHLDGQGELQELEEKLEDLEDAKDAILPTLDGNQGVPGAGWRRESKQTVTNSVDQRERVKVAKGKLTILDTVPGQGFKGPRKPAELTEEIRRASQEAPEAIDRQRLPRSASDMARGYFDKMRGDREKKDKP